VYQDIEKIITMWIYDGKKGFGLKASSLWLIKNRAFSGATKGPCNRDMVDSKMTI